MVGLSLLMNASVGANVFNNNKNNNNMSINVF